MIFIAAYVVVTFFIWFANDVFKVIAALLFGIYWSTLLVWIAEMINAVVLFNLSRQLGREFVEKQFKLKPVVSDEDHYFWRVFVLRIVPLIPFRFLDLGFGLTKISFKKYLIVALIASPLRLFWIQFVLGGAGEAILKDPAGMIGVLQEYLLQNRIVFLWSLGYLFVSIVLIIWYKKTNRKKIS